MIKLTCEKCNTVYEINQPHPYHAGFSELGFLYCDKCTNVVIWDDYDENYKKIIGKKVFSGHFPRVENIKYKVPWGLDQDEQKAVENALKPCPCGGQFKFNNELLCPNCKHPLADSILDTIYFYELGNEIDGRKVNIWKKEPPTNKIKGSRPALSR
jgi:uncharacterized protein YbaR (Trm112 family)